MSDPFQFLSGVLPPKYAYRVAGRFVAQAYQAGTTTVAWVTSEVSSLKEALQQMRHFEDSQPKGTFLALELWLYGYYASGGPPSNPTLYAYYKGRSD